MTKKKKKKKKMMMMMMMMMTGKRTKGKERMMEKELSRTTTGKMMKRWELSGQTMRVQLCCHNNGS